MLERYLAVRHAERMINLPYIWGGDDPIRGFDCSGLVVEILKSFGILPKVGDWAARQLAKMFPEVFAPGKGILVFFGSPGDITHVGFCINKKYMIEAGGGRRDTDDVEDAIAQNAYIRIRPIKSRSDIVMYNDPFKYTGGSGV